jgi:hypothetical protein
MFEAATLFRGAHAAQHKSAAKKFRGFKSKPHVLSR